MRFLHKEHLWRISQCMTMSDCVQLTLQAPEICGYFTEFQFYSQSAYQKLEHRKNYSWQSLSRLTTFSITSVILLCLISKSWIIFHLSIHPPSAAYSQSGLQHWQSKQRRPHISFPECTIQLFWWNPEAFPISPVWTCPKHLTYKALTRHLMRRRIGSTLSPSLMVSQEAHLCCLSL